MTMTLVSTYTVTSVPPYNIEFTSIPQTGTDLLILTSLREAGDQTNITFQMNSQGGTWRNLTGNGSSASSNTSALFYINNGVSTTSNTFGNAAIYIPNYTSATAKSVSIDLVTENNGTTAQQTITAGLSTTTSAITSILFSPGNGFATGSTVSVYTITKGSGGATVS